MEALLFYATLFVLGFFPFLAVLAAGGGLEVLLRGVFQNPVHPELRLARIVALGFVWTLGCFGVSLVFFQVGFRPSALWSLVYFFASAMLAFLAWRRAGIACREIFSPRVLAMLGGAVAIAALMQVPSLLWFPHIMDSTQLGWTNRFTDPLSIQYGEMNGAVGYSGLIFFTGLLAPHLPLAVSAASTKILLYFLCVLLTFYIARVFYGPNFHFGAVLCALILIGSSFGLIILFVGKDSLFGVVFTVFYVASLADGKLQDGYRTTALLCGSAAFMGVISVPFLAIAFGLAFMLTPDFRSKWNLASSHLIIAGPMAAFAAQAMAKIPFWYVVLGFPIIGVAIALLGRLDFWNRLKTPRLPFWIPVLLILGTYFIGMKALPYLLKFENYTCDFMAPLDGKTGFIALIFDYNNSSGLVTSFYLLGPIVSLWIWRREDPARWSPFLFQQITLAVFLLLCVNSSKLVDAPSQHTLIKNCIHYFLPPVAAMALGPVVGLMPNSWVAIKGFALFFGLIFAGSAIESLAKYQSKTGVFYLPHRSGVIQSNNREIPPLSNFLWQRQFKARLIVDSATGFEPIGDFNYFSPRVRFWVEKEGGVASKIGLEKIKEILSSELQNANQEEVYVLTTEQSVSDLRNSVGFGFEEVLKIPSKSLVLLKTLEK